ncbi:MAG: DegT/DnrJ/EryC1/StrS family aminotransferase [Halobacteriota archaeon]
MIPIAAPTFGPAEREAVADVLKDGTVADGPVVREFESEFASFCGVDHGAGMANGTLALHAALEALDIGAGDTVVTTPFSFVASANAIRLAGATPAFADIDPETFALDPQSTEQRVRETDADAILAVHLYGLPADVAALADIAEDAGIPLVEDAAQAHGAEYGGDPVGSFGDAAAFSFYPTKNMTTGEGGMVVTDREDVARRAASFANHGRTQDGTYAHERLGSNYRMTSLAAAIGRVQLDKLPGWVRSRRSNAARLTETIDRIPGVEAPVEPDGRTHAYHQYTIRTDHRERLRDELAAAGVDTAIYYPTPIHQLGAYDDFDVDAPVAERAAAAVVSLPVHPELSAADVETITTALQQTTIEA